MCWYSPLFCPRCLFLQSHVDFIWEGKKTIRWEWSHYGLSILRQVSHLKQYIQYVYVHVFSVCRWLYLLYTVHTCNNVLCTPTQPRANTEMSVKSHFKWGIVLTVLPLMLDAHGPSPHVVTLGWAISIYSCSCAAERVLQRHMTLLFHFSVEQENFCMTSTEQNNVTSETSVWDKCHKCNINCHIAVHAHVLSPSPLTTGYLLTLNPPSANMNCWQGLIRTQSVHITLPSTLIPNHALLNYSNGANPMHFSLCNIYSRLWCSSAICRKKPVIAIQY